jgi:hypothetical protein
VADANVHELLTQKDGRTLERLGLAGKSVEQMKRVFETGP